MKQIDLEAGMPDVSSAMSRLNNQIYAVRATGVRECKIIHGYGSSGKGGAIKSACLMELRGYKRRGIIKEFCPGEKFGPFSEEGRRMTAAMPTLNRDRDWGRSNDGITVILFR